MKSNSSLLSDTLLLFLHHSSSQSLPSQHKQFCAFCYKLSPYWCTQQPGGKVSEAFLSSLSLISPARNVDPRRCK